MLLNQDLQFDEVRWATTRKTSYDSRMTFKGDPQKTVLTPGAHLFRLVHMANGRNFDGVWWVTQKVFDQLRDKTNRSSHGGGRLLRNYIAESLSLPSGSHQLCVIEIALTTPVYAWVGHAAALFDRPGGVEQIFLPHLPTSGAPGTSDHARLVHTYWLNF